MFVTLSLCLIAFANAQCGYKSLRLYGGLHNDRGVVQLCDSQGQWRAVCDYNWDCDNTRASCRQLNYHTQKADDFEEDLVYVTNFGPSNTSFVGLGPYYCSNEYGLVNCSSYGESYRTNQQYCSTHQDTVWIDCSIISDCSDGDVRLVGGLTAMEGRVEYCFNGRWAPICIQQSLTSTTASVICYVLGYQTVRFASVFNDGRYGSSDIRSRFRYISCDSSDRTLSDCNMYDYSSYCGHIYVSCTEHYGIKCFNSVNCDEGSVRLINGTVEKEGRVEVCINGVWGSVCDSSFSTTDGYVVCRQLGYQNGARVYHNSKYSDGESPIVMSYVSCVGHESSLLDCGYTNYFSFGCSRDDTVGVMCLDDCEDGDIRVVDGDSENEGTIQICLDNIWGLIADEGWDETDAEVACSQLGYGSNGAEALRGSHYSHPNRPVRLNNVNCEGYELSIDNCIYYTYDLEYGKTLSTTVDVAGIKCAGTSVTSTTTTTTPNLITGNNESTVGVALISLGAVMLFISTVIIIRQWKKKRQREVELEARSRLVAKTDRQKPEHRKTASPASVQTKKGAVVPPLKPKPSETHYEDLTIEEPYQ